MRQKGIVHLFLLVVVILVAIGAIGYLAYQNAQLKKQTEETLPIPETTEIQVSPTKTLDSPTTTSAPSSSWETYTNDNYGFSFKHPDKGEVNIIHDKYIAYRDAPFGELSYVISIFINENPDNLTALEFKYRNRSEDEINSILPHLNISEVQIGNTSATRFVDDKEYFSQQALPYTSYNIVGRGIFISIVTPEYYGIFDGNSTSIASWSHPKANEITEILSTFTFSK